MSENKHNTPDLPEFLNAEPDDMGAGLINMDTGERISWGDLEQPDEIPAGMDAEDKDLRLIMEETDPQQKMMYAKLRQLQSLNLHSKITLAKQRIAQFFEKMEGRVVVSFSGGADSTVLLHLARQVSRDIPAVFVNTGLEYPEIVRFVRQTENVEIIKPTMAFRQVLENYGYPVISKEVSGAINEIRTTKSERLRNLRLHGSERGNAGKLSDKYKYLLNAPFKISDKCCYILKKQPLQKYCKDNNLYSIVGVMAEESRRRLMSYMRYGCNAFGMVSPQSRPLMAWNKQDILHYLQEFKIPYCKDISGDMIPGDLFDDGKVLMFSREQRTGCTYCMFGVHKESYPNRFQRMQRQNPKQYDFCINTLGLGKVLEYCHIPFKLKEEDDA